MDQKAYIHLEINKQGRVYHFQMPFGSSYQECYDVAIEFANKIIEISQQAEEARKKQQEESVKVLDQAAMGIKELVAQQENGD